MALRVDRVPAELAARAPALHDLGAVPGECEHLLARRPHAETIDVERHLVGLRRLDGLALRRILVGDELDELEQDEIALLLIADRQAPGTPDGFDRPVTVTIKTGMSALI
jgi:hypothetical protein